ncbi:MAG: aspartyl/asparaginyl beta-hydroxylase domain-containing protein, partial [Aquimonas sp.]
MSAQIEALAQAAAQAAQKGHWQLAEQLWRQLLAQQPGHPQALHSLGLQAFRRGAFGEALELLQQAHRVAPREPMILLSVAMVLRERGDVAGEARAIEAALQADPYCLPALLAKAAMIEHQSGYRAATPEYRNALKVAPPESRWPAALRAGLLRARECVERTGREMAEYLEFRLGQHRDRLSAYEAERWREAGAIVSGQSQPYPSLPNRLLVPRLPAVPFFDRADFSWVEALEARTPQIIEEMQAAHRLAQDEFRPYVAYAPGTPVNQWHELNHSARWSSYFLWRNGASVPEHQDQCPQTTAALAEVEMAEIGGLCPNAMFSALAPNTAIPPHHGETNARLVVHLPLVVPPNCTYRVGFERRQWTVGE